MSAVDDEEQEAEADREGGVANEERRREAERDRLLEDDAASVRQCRRAKHFV